MTVTELFTNPPTAGVSSPLAQLSVDITTTPAAGTVESYAVSAAAPPALRAASGRFRVLVDHEIMVVTASVSGSSPWEFERGAEGSTPAPHSSGAAIHHVLTAGALATKADLDSGTGLLLDSQTPAAVAATLAGLGSAATHPAGDFDPAGAAAAAQAAAEAASDPAGAAAAAQAAAEAASDPAGAAAAAQAAAEAASDPAGSAAAAQAAAITAAEAASLPVGTTLDQVSGAAGDVSLHGHRITSLAAATAGTDALNRETGDARYVAVGQAGAGAQTATLGRTSTINVPALRDFVSVLDAPWGAKGDAKQVTDATIASGTNQLHSTAGAFTTAVDVGKQVNVVGAGAAGAVLTAYIGSVSGGVASLVTTAGGSTPANASTTIASGGTVNYGTLDTTALQNGINAVSNAGGGQLLLPAGFQFLVGQVKPKSNVVLWCYGATVYMDQTAANGVFFYQASDGILTRWHIRGGVWVGTGKEGDNQQIFSSQSASTSSDVRFIDMHVTSWFSGPLYIRNAARARAIDNTMLNCGGSPAFYNQINFVAETNSACYELIARGNVIENAGAIGIDVVCGTLSSDAAVRYIVTDNYVSTSVGGGVNVEWVSATAGSYTDFTIANNTIVQTSTASNAFAMSASSSTQTDPTILRRMLIKGNTIVSATGGLTLNASDAICEGNFVQAAKLTILCGKGAGGVSTVTATTSNGSANLSAVSVLTGAPLDGSPVSGTGITEGTFVKSGTGTSAWALSLPAIANGTVTLTVYAQNKNVTIHNNVLRCAKDPAQHAFLIYGLRNSTVSENRVIVDPGTTSSTFHGLVVTRCGWMNVHHNHVEYAPGHGIKLDGNDFNLHHNRTYNCSEDTAGFCGILVTNISGTVANVTENTMIDDRAVHKMAYGLDVSTATNNQVCAPRNHMHGYTGARSINGQCAPGSIGNDDDQNPGGALVLKITASGTWSIPAGATLLRVTSVGGGGGGAGGCTPASALNAVGGSGGAAGMFATLLVSVGAATSASAVVGAGGNLGTGGAAGGNPGGDGSAGGASTLTIGAVVVRALGGGRGLGPSAGATSTRAAFLWGSSGPGATANSAGVGAGGGSGIAGGDSVGYVGGGGAGGGAANATNGGGAGAAGSLAGASSSAGSAGASGTAAGVDATAAAANSGAGGGGGGGGSFNGGAGGKGGDGGAGGSGYIQVEVVA